MSFRIVFLLFVLITSRSANGEIVRFIEGGEADVPIRVVGSEIILETPMGEMRFPRSDFSSIEPGNNPRRDWPERRTKALSGGAVERYEAARWALDRGLIPECEAMLREAFAADPIHQPTARMVGVLNKLKLGLSDPDMAPLIRTSPADHRISRGPHTVLIHQHTEPEAAERIAILEQVITAYYLYFASLGLELPVPEKRLPSIWFARKDDYLAFLRLEGADAFLTTRGYHHPARGLVAAYDCRDDAAKRAVSESIAARRVELDRLTAKISKIRPGSRVRIAFEGVPARDLNRDEARTLEAQLRRQVARQEMVQELTRREIDWGVAAHETIHQLMAASRLGPRYDSFPSWLNEGLAMQFETIRGGRWAGLGSPSPLRLRDYRQLKKAPELVSTARDVGFGRGYHADSYARAWSLVYYLREARPPAFQSLLDGLRLPDSATEPPSVRACRILLTSLGGDPTDEETQWHRWMKALP